MDISIRPYAPADFETVTSLWHDAWESTGVPALVPLEKHVSLETLRERLPKEIAGGWSVHVAIAEHRVVGFVATIPGHLNQLFVAPAAQSRGIGKRLLDFAKAQQTGGFTLTTPMASRAVQFYEREGLVAESTSTHPRYGHERVHFRWTPD
jgi:GNAT superfamily N-acetyltransferase